MSRDSGAGTVMAAFMMGALTGAALALLFAPASGEETREYIGQKAREGRDRARDAVEQGKDYYQRQRQSVASAVERGREAFQQARERGEQQA
jgi:gas vesicle protein